MPVSLSIKNAPDEIVRRLRERAERASSVIAGGTSPWRSLRPRSKWISADGAARRPRAGSAPGTEHPERVRGDRPSGSGWTLGSSTHRLSPHCSSTSPRRTALRTRITGCAAPGFPFLLEFELANVCLIKSRRHPGQMPTLIEAFRLLDQLGVEAMAVDHVGVVTLAAETNLPHATQVTSGCRTARGRPWSRLIANWRGRHWWAARAAAFIQPLSRNAHHHRRNPMHETGKSPLLAPPSAL